MKTEQIAVIGLSCLFPDAENPEQFWQNLVQGKDSTSNATIDEFGVDPKIFQGEGKENPDQTYSLKGGFIRNFRFDASGYAIAPETIAGLDPIAQASLYVARQALQNSGYWESDWGEQLQTHAPSALRAKCGVILGNLSLPLHHSNRLFGPMYQAAIAPAVQELLQDPEFRFAALPGTGHPIDPLNARMSSLPSQIVAQALSLSTLHFALDAACSSSLYAVELARHYLLSGEADLMLAGAASYSDSLFVRMLFSGLQAYPDNGVSCPFDERSRGLTPADGVGMLVLKRYSDAVRDGDTIHAIVSGVGLSNDGRGKHLLSPNQKGQVIAFERAYEAAALSPQDVDYVECHATGTLLGDSTELSSIDEFFHSAGAKPLVGAVKANTGHLLTAAGMVSLLKVILGMEHGLIPPTINLQQPQTSPNGVVSRDRIVTEPTPWPVTGRPKRTAINAFGFGGTNAHLILEEAPPVGSAASPETRPEARPQTHPETPFTPHQTQIPLAIVGMDACFGDADGLDAVDRAFYDGVQQFKPLPKQRWQGVEHCTDLLKAYGFEAAPQGAYIDHVEIDPIRYKIPPNEVNKLQPQQLLMLKVADRALQDAQIKPGDNVAVLIAMETELSIHQLQQRWNFDWQVEAGLAETGGTLPADKLAALTQILKDSLHPPAQTSEYVGYIGNIMPSRISALWDFKAPSFTLSAGEDSALKALEVAQNLLAYGHADAVLVGAVDLAGGFEQVLLRNQVARINTAKTGAANDATGSGQPTLSFDQQAQGAMIGEGAGAVVLKRLETARQEGDRIYAVVDALRFANLPSSGQVAGETASDCVAQVCAAAYTQAGLATADIGYLEVCGSGIPQADSAEMIGLTQTYRLTDVPVSATQFTSDHLTCALGSATATLGHTGVAAAIASLIKTALCLYHRYIPAVPHWSAPQQPESGVDIWAQTPFYVASESRGWLLGAGFSQRRAALSHISAEGIVSHLVLSEELAQPVRSKVYLEQRPFHLFPIAGRDRADLEANLAAFEQALSTSDCLAQLARATFKTYRQHADLPYALTLVGGQKDKLARDLSKAGHAIAKAFETGQDWQAPSGSFFTANPQGHPQGVNGKVAFVYPGAFGCYMGQVRDRFRLFPEIFNLPLLEQLKEPLGRIDRMFYPRSLTAFSRRDLEALDLQLLADPIMMFESEIGCSGITTAMLQDCFKIQPHMTFGYSLGEISMMLSQRVFEDEAVGRVSAQLAQSPLFHNRIAGAKNAVRDYWGMPQVAEDNGQDLWSNFVIVAAADDVRAAIAPFDRVYLTQINTANEVVIAGDPALCQQVIDSLGCQGFRAPFNYVMHCQAMASEQGELARMNTLPIKPDLTDHAQVYSTAAYAPIPLDSQSIGEAIATNLCRQIDLPRLVNQVYNDGARIFLEVGAGSTCSRWISTNLADKPHLVASLNRRGTDDKVSVLQALAKLVSHRVPLELMPLYGDVDAPEPKRAMVKTVPLGGVAIAETILSEANRAEFKDIRVERVPQLQVQPEPQPQPELQPQPEPQPQPDERRFVPTGWVDDLGPVETPIAVETPAAVAATATVAAVATVDDRLANSQIALSQAHAAFLANRKAALQKMRDLLTPQ